MGFRRRECKAPVSDSPVSRCPVPWCSKVPLVVTAQSTAASLCHWRGVFASLLAGEGSQPRSYCQHEGGRPVPGRVGAHTLRHTLPSCL